MRSITLAFFAALTAALCADQFFPVNSSTQRPDPVASPYAVPGGSITEYLGPSPKSLNYYLDNNMMSAKVFDALFESLVGMDADTLEYDRAIAKKWSISDDKLTFTFWIDENARWSDGKPITAEDVVWTYQTVLNPTNLTGPHKLSLERLHAPEIVDNGTAVRFRAKEVHWQNLGAAGGFSVLPKHVFAGKDFNQLNFDFPVVSGPYRVKEIREGFHLVLERRHDWWRRQWPAHQGIHNFQEIKYRFFEDRNNAFEAFVKGEIDVFAVYTASQWHQIETKISAIRNNWIVKQAIHNSRPVGFQGFAMNMRRPPFDDVRVRKAMALLLDRETMNQTMMYNQYFLHRSYWEDLYDDQHPCPNQLVPYDKQAARALLAEAGWAANPATGILEKNAQPLQFTFLNRDEVSNKFLAVFDAALKDVGIKMTVQNKDWSAWAKDMDAFSFDMTWAAWGAGLFKNPEGMWASKEADRPAGSNITGFKNSDVDAIIDKQKNIFNVQERHELCRQLDAIVFNQHPYALLWNINYTRLLYWNKFGTPPTVLGKYSDESTAYWWYDEDADAELKDAMNNNRPLPKPPADVWFNKAIAK